MIEYNFSGEWDSYNRLLRKYQLSGLLTEIGKLSNDIFFDSEKGHCRGVLHKKIHNVDAIKKTKRQDDVILTAWNLIDIAYYAIISSNDFRGKQIESENELYVLATVGNSFMQKKENDLLKIVGDGYKFFHYLWGFAGEQFKIQTPGRVFDNAGRELYMLFEIAPRINSIDIASVIYKEVGISWEVLCKSLFFAWFGFSKESNLDNLKKTIKWNDSFTEDMFNRVLERYSATYSEVKSNPLKRQFLYTHPYIKTQQDGLIGINSYLNLFLYEHAILWTARDYYLRKDDTILTSEFGRVFEEYFRELVCTYIDESDVSRISEETTERADWNIRICGYDFLVEQKSTLAKLSIKQQNSDYQAMIDFSTKTLIKALKQLETTEKELKNGLSIKIILLYDDFINSNLIDYVFGLPTCPVQNDGRYWLVNIETMERFLSLAKTDLTACKNIIEEKLELDSIGSKEGKSLEYLLDKHVGFYNEYLRGKKIYRYIKHIENECRKMLS